MIYTDYWNTTDNTTKEWDMEAMKKAGTGNNTKDKGEDYSVISVLCVMNNSNYYNIPGLDLWDEKRDAYNYKGNNKIIAHPPCQQWSRLKGLAKPDLYTKMLGPYCVQLVRENGGIVEQPNGSTLFKHMGITKNIIKVNQKWWGFRANKETLLWFNQVTPIEYPLNFNLPSTTVENMSQNARSKQTTEFCNWLIQCLRRGNSKGHGF